MFILLLLLFVSTCTANSGAVAGNKKFTFNNVIDDINFNQTNTGLNLDQMCLRGYVKGIHNKNIKPNSLRLYGPNPVSLTLTLCTPQKPICMSRRDTVQLKGSPNITQYFRFGCKEPVYWKACEIKPNIRSAVFCATNIHQQLWEKGAKLGDRMRVYMVPLTQSQALMNKTIRYVSMSEKKRRDLYSDYGDVHDYVETGERTYKKMYALLVIMLVAGGYKTWTTYIKIKNYKKRNTQVDMDAPDPNDTDEDYKTSNSSSTDSNIHH